LPRLRRRAALAALVVAVHATLFAASALAQGWDQLRAAENTRHLSQPWSRLPTTLLEEWLLPYAPFAVLWLGGFARRSLRRLTLCHALCLGGYLALTNAVLGHFEPWQPVSHERGAFLVGICLPTVLLGVAWLPQRLRLAAAVAAAALALVGVRRADWQPAPPGFEAGLLRVAAREPLELWAGSMERDAGWVRKASRRIRHVPVAALPSLLELAHRSGGAASAEQVVAWFDVCYDELQRQGHSLLITPGALDLLRASADPRLRRLAVEHLPDRYRMEQVAEDAFVAFRLRRR
jgi:hypothetical protein